MISNITFDDFIKKDIPSIISMIANTNSKILCDDYLEITSEKSPCDLAPILKKFSKSFWFIKEINLRLVNDDDSHSFFLIDILIPGAGTLRLKFDWNVWDFNHVENIANQVIKPIYQNGFANRFIIQSSPAKKPQSDLLHIMEVAKEHNPNQSCSKTTIDEFLIKLAMQLA